MNDSFCKKCNEKTLLIYLQSDLVVTSRVIKTDKPGTKYGCKKILKPRTNFFFFFFINQTKLTG